MKNNNYNSEGLLKTIVDKAQKFIDKTQEHALQGVNTGGVYQALRCGDTAYILKDWFLYGNNIPGVMQQLYQITKNQVRSITVRITTNQNNEIINGKAGISDQNLYNRSLHTLNAIKNRAWKEKWPLVTEVGPTGSQTISIS
ncbi:MAG TPA: hypothetical protein VFS97_00190 [Nitrososphaeraceae archaeon]|nr:hypothetical protein [Nitrososphaeraceae archaeon]